MDITSYRKDFVIYIVDDESSIREVLKEALAGVGYQVDTFSSAEDAVKKIVEAPPHLIFSDIRMPGMSGIELLKKVRELSNDIEYIIMTSHASMDTAVDAMKFGAQDYIFKPFEDLNVVIKTADRTIERVFVKMQNEQLLEELSKKNKLLAEVNQRISMEKKEVQLINSFMQRLSQRLDPDAVIYTLLDSVSEVSGGKPLIFMRWVPSHVSLVAVSAARIPIEKVKNIGVRLPQIPPAKITEVLTKASEIPALKEMMREGFGAVNFETFPFIHQENPAGIIVSFQKIQDELARRLIESFIHIAAVAFDNAMMSKRIHEMAVRDPLTGLYNRRFFNEKLEAEIKRSRRTLYPLSLIYLDVDHFKKYNDTNGHPMGDVILKTVTAILQNTSRTSDVVARLGGEEFAIICPDTALEGAAVKAEKIRMTIEQTKFPNGEKQPLGKVTVSLGVSEYPRIASDAQSLIRAADDALYKVKQGGRNRVVVATAAQGFKPDFVALEVPGTKPAMAGTGGTAA